MQSLRGTHLHSCEMARVQRSLNFSHRGGSVGSHVQQGINSSEVHKSSCNGKKQLCDTEIV